MAEPNDGMDLALEGMGPFFLAGVLFLAIVCTAARWLAAGMSRTPRRP